MIVCGLGPAGPDLVTAGTAAAVRRVEHRFLRTARHPAAGAVDRATAFDPLYESAGSIDEVYDRIVDELAEAAARHGEVLYAVPGSPSVAERTVELLLADTRVSVEVLPALSFADLAWVRLGVDPVAAGVRLVDGHRFEVEAAGERAPLLVGQCDTVAVLSDVKLALDAALDVAADRTLDLDGGPHPPPEGPTVTVLQRLGLPDESIVELPWHQLDRAVEPDHLTSVYVPELAAPVAGEVVRIAEVVRRLRADCPWDRQQTHASLRRHLLEEAYEVLEALDHLDVDAGVGFEMLEEELGDLLFQIVFHATLAAEEGRFTLADVARGVGDKLIGRHPHVFGDVTVSSAEEVAVRWEQLKKAEKGRASVMDGIPATLPALLYASAVQKKASSQGTSWRDLAGPSPGPAGPGPGPALSPGSIGFRLLELVEEARGAGVDPETELRVATEHVRDRFRAAEG